MDIKDILEMKKDSEHAKSESLIKDSLIKVIFATIRIEGNIIIKRDLDKDHIRHTLEYCKNDIRGRYINPLKDYISPDTYLEVNELLANKTGYAIKILCEMYDDRHHIHDLIDVLKEMFGGEDDED